MSEIKKKLIKLREGEVYTASGEDYVITEGHTISDIIRYLVSCDSKSGIIELIDNIEE